MNIDERHREMATARAEMQRKMLISQIWQSCLNCEEWNAQYNGCNKFQQTPPADIIVVGCPDYIPNIPF